MSGGVNRKICLNEQGTMEYEARVSLHEITIALSAQRRCFQLRVGKSLLQSLLKLNQHALILIEKSAFCGLRLFSQLDVCLLGVP